MGCRTLAGAWRHLTVLRSSKPPASASKPWDMVRLLSTTASIPSQNRLWHTRLVISGRMQLRHFSETPPTPNLPTILARVTKDSQSALKSKNQLELNALRNIRNALLSHAKSIGVSEDKFEDAQAIKVLQKVIKQRNESIESYEAGKRMDLVEREKYERDVVQRYMNTKQDLVAGVDAGTGTAEDQTQHHDTMMKWIDEAVKQSGASSPKQVGQVMGVLMKQHKTQMEQMGLLRETARIKDEVVKVLSGLNK